MTSKERMLTAMAHEEPDRVPTGEWQFGPEIIEPALGRDPLFFNGLRTNQAYWDGRRDEVIDDWKHGLVELVRHFGWDAVLVHTVIDRRARINVPEKLDAKRWRFANGTILTYSEETDRLMVTEQGAPMEEAAPPVFDDPLTPSDSEMEVVRHVVRELGKTHFIFSLPLSGHRAPPFANIGKPAGKPREFGSMDVWVDMFENPETHRDQFLEGVRSERMRSGVARIKDEGLDGVAYSRDFGMNTGPFISPEVFRVAILPGLSELCDLAHEHGLKLLMHSCGNNVSLMDMIVEAGVDVYQSIQTEMDIVSLKRRYGRNITLWGGVPAGDLVRSTPEKVKAAARHYLDACRPGGGYVFATSHSIMPGAKYENYQAMLQALADYGGDGGS